MTRKMLTATAIALTTALTAPAAPALAGGSFSIQIEPHNQDERDAIRAGLFLYAVVEALDSSANISQRGNNNAAGIRQTGAGSFGVVHQEGNGHTATLDQRGNGQAYGVFQFGQGTESHTTQNFNGDTGLLFQVGW